MARVWRFFPLLLLLLAAAAVPAAPPAPPAAPVDPKVTALLDRMNALQKEIQTLRVSFVQTNRFQMLKEPQVLKGVLLLKKPSTALYRYTSPARLSYLVKDGDLLIVDAAARKVVVQDIRRHQNKILRYLAVGQPLEEITRNLEMRTTEWTNGTLHVELVPLKLRTKRKVSALHFWVDGETALLSALEVVQPDGDRIRFDFSRWETNPALTDDDFRVEIPKGAKVQRQFLDVEQPFGR